MPPPALVVTQERTIPALPEALWPRVSDPALLPTWFRFAESIEVLDGEPGARERAGTLGRSLDALAAPS